MKRSCLVLVLALLLGIVVVPSPILQVSAQEYEQFEDGFESGDFGKWGGTNVGSKATATCVRSRPHSGSYCARFASSGNAVYCYNLYDSDSVFVSCYIRVAPSSIVADNASVFFCSLGSEPFFYLGWRRVDGEIKWTIFYDGWGTWETTIFNESSPSLNQWHKVEVHYSGIVTDGILRIDVDGISLYDGIMHESDDGEYYAPHVDSVAVGIVSSFNCRTARVYVDDCYTSSWGE